MSNVSEIVTVIQQCSPALAGVILLLWIRIRSQTKDIETLRKRLDDYDALKISTQLAAIQTDLAWIKEKLSKV